MRLFLSLIYTLLMPFLVVINTRVVSFSVVGAISPRAYGCYVGRSAEVKFLVFVWCL